MGKKAAVFYYRQKANTISLKHSQFISHLHAKYIVNDYFFLNSALQRLFNFSETKCEVLFHSQETSHDRCSSPYLRKKKSAIIYSSLTVAVEGHRIEFTHSRIQTKPFDWHMWVIRCRLLWNCSLVARYQEKRRNLLLTSLYLDST